MKKKLLAIFAHPDDEAFGPGGTLAKYAEEGVEIHLLCATKGEEGMIEGLGKKSVLTAQKIGEIREKELRYSARILGIKKVEFLGFQDGTLCNAFYHQLAEKIIRKIQEFSPQVVLTNERLGVSGHLDHIAVSMITTYAFLKSKKADKLYYFCLPREIREREKNLDKYFIYFPEGYPQKEITTRINYQFHWEKKVAAMKAHQSQKKDVIRLLRRYRKLPKIDHFLLFSPGKSFPLPETDLFAGLFS